jgi:hypothetical protein
MPRDVKEGIQSGVKTINGNISTSLQALGVDKENADPISRILWNATNIAASLLGPKIGNSVSSTVRSAALPTAGSIGRTLGISGRSLATNTGRAIGTLTNMAVQASPDLLSLAVDHLENGTDDTVPTKLVTGIEAFLGANMAAVAPLFPGKKALQTQLDIEEVKATPETKPAIETEIKPMDIPEATITPEMKTAIETPASDALKPKKSKKVKTIKETVLGDTSKDLPFTDAEKKDAGIPTKPANVIYQEDTNTSLAMDSVLQNNTGIPMKSMDVQSGNKGTATVKIPDAQFKLGLSGVTGLKNISSVLSRNFNTSRFLNNIRVQVGKAFVPLGNFIDSAQRAIRPEMKDAILNNAGITAKNTAGLDAKAPTVNPKDLIGTKSPEGVEITAANVGEFMKTFDNIKFFDKNIAGLDLKQTQNIVRASYLYDFLKQHPEKLSSYFAPEQIAFLRILDEMEQGVYGKVSAKAKADDVLGDVVLDDDYRHYDVIRQNFDRIPNSDKSHVSIVTPDGRTIQFNSQLELATWIKNNKKYGTEVDPSTFSVLEQDKKGIQIEPYRTHGAAARLISYADAMGKFYSDDMAIKLLDQVRNSKDPAVKEYVARAFDSKYNKNIAEQFLGVSDAGIVAK